MGKDRRRKIGQHSGQIRRAICLSPDHAEGTVEHLPISELNMILAATGHRPDKLGGYAIEVQAGLMMLAVKHIGILKPTEVISGMALGWDMAVAEAALFCNLPLVAAVPFKGQEEKWSPLHQGVYRALLAKASEVVIVSDGIYQPWKMFARNTWMVDRCDHMLALWDGSEAGGTWSCMREAKRCNRPVTNVWDEWRAGYPILKREQT